MMKNARLLFVAAITAVLVVAIALPDMANARPKRPKIPGALCTLSQLNTIATNYSQRVLDRCTLASGSRAMYCSDGKFACCDDVTGSCTSWTPIVPPLSTWPSNRPPHATSPGGTPNSVVDQANKPPYARTPASASPADTVDQVSQPKNALTDPGSGSIPK